MPEDVEHARAQAPARRLVRYGVTGLAVGGFVGFFGALRRPRRVPRRRPETYPEARVPVRPVPQQRSERDAHALSLSASSASSSSQPGPGCDGHVHGRAERCPRGPGGAGLVPSRPVIEGSP